MKRRGMLLPTILLLISVLVVLAGSVMSMTTGGVLVTRQGLESERALRLADAGLATATAKLYAGSLGASLAETLDDGKFQVSVTSNPGAAAMSTPYGLDLPPRATLLRSVGTTRNGAQRISLALFRNGLGAFQVGALADSLSASNSTFDSYDASVSVTPVPVAAPQGILATNHTDTTISLSNNSTVSGKTLVGPGGDATAQIVTASNSTTTERGSLAAPIRIPPVTVPEVANAHSDVGGATGPGATPAILRIPNQRGATDTTVSPPTRPADPVLFSHYCLSVKIWPDGRFYAEEGGSSSKLWGSFSSTGSPTITQRAGSGLTASGPGLKLVGQYHSFAYNPATTVFKIDQQNGNTIPRLSGSTPIVAPTLPAWAYFTQPEQEAVDPSALPEGKYNNVNLTSSQAELVDGGVYVIRNLHISNNGKLHLAANAKNVKIYVTGSMEVDGLGTIANDSLLPANLKIFYTGTQPVLISAGAAAYFSLFAPGAEVTLTGRGSEFFGALVTKKLSLNDALFHYDISTRGVGTGEDATAYTLLARYRF